MRRIIGKSCFCSYCHPRSWPCIANECLIICTVVELIVEINASVRGCALFEKYFKTDRSEMRKISFLLSMAALTYFADIINCIYMVGSLILHMLQGEKENEENRNAVGLYKM